MATRRFGIKKIEDKDKRQVSFFKKRERLFKKADALAKMFGAELAILTISDAGSVYAFGNPTVDSVIQRYKAHISSSDQENEGNDDEQEHNLPETDDSSGKKEECEEKGLINLPPERERNHQDTDKKVEEGFSNSKMVFWDVPIENLRLDELEQLMAQMEEMKTKVLNQTKRSSAE